MSRRKSAAASLDGTRWRVESLVVFQPGLSVVAAHDEAARTACRVEHVCFRMADAKRIHHVHEVSLV